MSRMLKSPAKYVQGKGIMSELDQYLQGMGKHRLFLPPAEPGVPLVANTTIARRALALASFKPLRIDYLVSLLKRSSNSFVVILPIIYRTSLVRVGTSVHRYDSHPLSSGNLQRYRIGHKK